MGEAEELVEPVLEAILGASNRDAALAALAALPARLRSRTSRRSAAGGRACDDALLPAFSAIRTPHTELSRMFLIETERGCSRGCTLLRDAALDQRRDAHRTQGSGSRAHSP